MEIDISRNEFINQCIDFALKNIDTEFDRKCGKKHITAEAERSRLDSEQDLKMMKKKKRRGLIVLVFSFELI